MGKPFSAKTEVFAEEMDNVQDGQSLLHVTTITGPQAEALLKVLENPEKAWTYVNKSVPGVAIVEIWQD